MSRNPPAETASPTSPAESRTARAGMSAEEREIRRLAALARYTMLDSDPEESFDRITRLAATVAQTPIALLSFIDNRRQWMKSRIGIDLVQTGRDGLFATHPIDCQQPLVVQDTHAHSTLATSALVQGKPYLRFYASVPLVTPDGFTIGSLAVADLSPRQMGGEALAALGDLAKLSMDELELRQIATIDALTGVLTRRALFDTLEREFARTRRGQRGFSLIVFDIDRFKSINDSLGHPAGDEVLGQVARLCRKRLRSSDAIGRLGGEEFAILLAEASIERAAEVAERLRSLIEGTAFTVADTPFRVTASFGAAYCDAAGPPPETLIAIADQAMYDAKQAGRNSVVVAERSADIASATASE